MGKQPSHLSSEIAVNSLLALLVYHGFFHQSPYGQMDRVNLTTYIPELLKKWGVPEFQERSTSRGRAIKGGRRSGIFKGVYTAENEETHAVAIKIVNIEYSAKSNEPERRLQLLVEYFKRECQIWRVLGNHPNIVPLLGFVRPLETEVFPALIMPYYDGNNLRAFIGESELTLKDKIKLASSLPKMVDVAYGIQHMHSLKPPAIHRDLKASNVMVEIFGDRAYRARIADFGSAKLSEVESEIQVATGTSAPVSFSWTPPEYVKTSNESKTPVIDHTNHTIAGDIWSFGCTFLEVLQRANPWEGYSVDTELLERRHPPRPENGEIDDSCWDVMLVCWFIDPARRPNAKTLIENLLKIERALPDSTKAGAAKA